MSEICKQHDKYMAIAIEEALKSTKDVPVGAVIVKDNNIIAKACNKKELENNPIHHAEMLVIQEAAKITGNWRLDDMVLYVTLEPCPMCAAAILYSRIPTIVFGAYDSLYGAFGSALNMTDFIKFTPHVIGGVQEERCSAVLKDFFEEQRKQND